MKPDLCRLTILAAVSCTSGIALAQPKTDPGKQEYEWHCATCHGVNGTGNGELRRFLTTAPTDLTTISKRNGGAFPPSLQACPRTCLSRCRCGTSGSTYFGKSLKRSASSAT